MNLPAVPATFEWTTHAWGPALRCLPLSDVAPHLFTTRQLQLSAADGDAGMLAGALGADRVLMLTQVHGRDVAVARRDERIAAAPRHADAWISNRPDVAVAVRAADCVPILIGDRVTGAVAAVHAGWRGTAAGIVRAAVAALTEHFRARPSDLVVAIGPSIGACCYDVGHELVDAFAAAGHSRELVDRWFIAPPPAPGRGAGAPLRLDLVTANRDQLILAGVPETQIFSAALCTAMHPEVLTSFRVERERAGRMAGAIRARA